MFGHSSDMNDQSPIEPIDRGWMVALGAIIVVGAMVVAGFALTAPNPAAASGAGLLTSGAGLLLGALAGFLFGIPRAQEEDKKDVGDNATKAGRGYKPNTNLEQISDWLTKILVGVGLTQLREIPGSIAGTAAFLSRSFGSNADGVAVGIILYFPTVGFLFGFLWTRLFLAGSLARADLNAALAAVEQKQQRQQQFDAAALAIVQQYLNNDQNEPRTADDVKSAVLRASPAVRVQIYYQAEAIRRENWSVNKQRMERTIPVFEALIEADTEQRFHKNHGQLAFALKEKHNPDFKRAIDELTTAINLRGPWQQFGWVIYEANRASCQMRLDPAAAAGKPAADELRALVLSDLQIAITEPRIADWFTRPPESDWLQDNQISVDQELAKIHSKT